MLNRLTRLQRKQKANEEIAYKAIERILTLNGICVPQHFQIDISSFK